MKHYARTDRHLVRIWLNGAPREGWCESRTLLSDFLRQELGATGTHVGCEHGVCGACTVAIDGEPARSCLTLAVQADGARIETVEGLAGADGALGDLQQAFRRHHALQCGYCTPGILISCERLLARTAQPDERAVREMLAGHRCRCTGYTGIVNAVLEVAAERGRKRA
jgi:2-furoyl-CoA dehydrogenase 2Fe-2S iron sulfur subunit